MDCKLNTAFLTNEWSVADWFLTGVSNLCLAHIRKLCYFWGLLAGVIVLSELGAALKSPGNGLFPWNTVKWGFFKCSKWKLCIQCQCKTCQERTLLRALSWISSFRDRPWSVSHQMCCFVNLETLFQSCWLHGSSDIWLSLCCSVHTSMQTEIFQQKWVHHNILNRHLWPPKDRYNWLDGLSWCTFSWWLENESHWLWWNLDFYCPCLSFSDSSVTMRLNFQLVQYLL